MYFSQRELATRNCPEYSTPALGSEIECEVSILHQPINRPYDSSEMRASCRWAADASLGRPLLPRSPFRAADHAPSATHEDRIRPRRLARRRDSPPPTHH